MIEKIIQDFLSDVLSVPVRMEIPNDPYERFVVLKYSGRGRESHLYAANLIAESHAKSLAEACALNERVIAALDELDRLDVISSTELASNYPVTDTENKKYRYQAVYEIYHY